MMIVGLTGGIGSGKTTVSKMFKALGVPVYDSDSEARKLMNTSSTLKEAITVLIGNEAYHEGKLQRNIVAEKVFADPELLEALNAIVHPAVKEHFKEWVKNQNAPYVIQEAAILFENGSYTQYHRMILVRAPKELRIERIMSRDNSTRQQILSRMKQQWEDERKVGLSDYVIDNLDLETTREQVKTIHRELLKLSDIAGF